MYVSELDQLSFPLKALLELALNGNRPIQVSGPPTVCFSETLLTAWFRMYTLQTLIITLLNKRSISFYGQGLNCGLEDVRVFNAHLERHGISALADGPLGETDEGLEAALQEYSMTRDADLRAICELALEN